MSAESANRLGSKSNRIRVRICYTHATPKQTLQTLLQVASCFNHLITRSSLRTISGVQLKHSPPTTPPNPRPIPEPSTTTPHRPCLTEQDPSPRSDGGPGRCRSGRPRRHHRSVPRPTNRPAGPEKDTPRQRLTIIAAKRRHKKKAPDERANTSERTTRMTFERRASRDPIRMSEGRELGRDPERIGHVRPVWV